MPGIESLNPSRAHQHYQFIIPDGMAVIAFFAGEEITAENVLNHLISPINNRPSILKDANPLAIDWYSTWHVTPRFNTIIPQNTD
jgi:hypothetical protein